MADIALQHSGSDVSAFHADAVRVCKELLQPWKEAGDADIKVSSLGGGITNALVKLEHVPTNEKVVVRRFGDDTNLFIDRAAEATATEQFNAHGFGAKVLATFSNGRVEQYLDARTLTPAEMRAEYMVPRIARRLAQFHAVNITGMDRTPRLWSTVCTWLEMVGDLTFDDAEAQRRHAALDLAAMAREIMWTKQLCDGLSSPVVFCHNDLLSGNILAMQVSEDADFDALPEIDLQLIDFEYGCFSLRGYDWGNHFNEWAGFDCEWDKCPSLQQQKTFLQAYLAQWLGREASEAEVNAAVAEAAAFSLASHIYWGVWSVMQARYSKIDFDYFGYSELRWARYHETKPDVEQTVHRHKLELAASPN